MAKKNTTGNVVDLNDLAFHNFSKGWSTDLDEHAEKNETYIDAWNCRLYSKNGTMSLVSITGEKTVYRNDKVKSYNGFYAFKDELIVFAKGDFELELEQTEQQKITEISVEAFEVATFNSNEILGVDFSSHYFLSEIIIDVVVPALDEEDFKQNLTEVAEINEIDVTYGNLFKALTYLPDNPITCSVGNDDIPINNQEYKDAIFSFSLNEEGMLVSKILKVGYFNIPMDAVITTEGVDENNFYKRVYFSDYYNSSRVVNVKDPYLSKRSIEQFEIKTKGMVLAPRINSINENGQLKAMTVFYVMKLVTDNGQVSDFSPLSKGVKVLKNTASKAIGGDIAEITNKSVKIDCYVPDFLNFKEIQLIAIEFEAKDVPTTIRLVGTKTVNAIVSFEHFGSEPEYLENVTLADLFNNSISWRYNSDFTTKNNKLLASGLRNDPLFVSYKNIALDFSLSGFDQNGETHDSLLNPDPTRFNYINTKQTESFFYIQRKLYRKIEVFGNFNMKLINNLTGDYYEYLEPKIIYSYVDKTSAILSFLLTTKTDPLFSSKFPNLNIKGSSNRILFEPIDETIKTDFYNYELVFSTTQVIIELDNDTEKKPTTWPTTEYLKSLSLVYGGVSNGWFNGNGVRVTMHSVQENVLTKNTDWMVSGSLPLNIKEPSTTKYFMKGEIYRVAIQWYKNGIKLFATVLGDIKIPDIGQPKRELDINGNVISTTKVYSNWEVVGDEMYSDAIQLQFDVRINCQLSQEVDSYQIVYVERTENNRTILAQGISAPLERLSDFTGDGDDDMFLEETIVKKWMLPSNGGPVYDERGLRIYDATPDLDDNSNQGRVITNRKAFYFDSPDIVYEKISTNFIESSRVEYVETVETDHDRYNIMGPYNKETASPTGSQAYNSKNVGTDEGPIPFGAPKFSQKIPSSLLSGDEKTRPFWVNVSVFSKRLRTRSYSAFGNTIASKYVFDINQSQYAEAGEILSGYKMNDKFDFANHAFTLASPGWFYQEEARVNGADKYSLFRVHNIAGGRNTVFLKTTENYFNTENISQSPFTIYSKVNFGTSNGRADVLKAHDAYIVSNLKRSNEESIYGGRSEFAYASNEYIPLTDTMPVITNRIASQIFYAEGDTYCTLYLRNKSSYLNTIEPEEKGFHWSRNSSKKDRKYQYNKYNAWCYAVVLESTVNARFTNAEEFYTFSKAISFDYEEKYNSVYMQENDLKKSLPIPYNFKDDPILDNVVAASNVKLNGDYIDSWNQFLTNEFYALDKNMGAVLNIIKDKDSIYVIQERQTSKLLIDEKNFITPDKGGAAIQINQGDGASISGHEIISDYGTSFRRCVVPSPFGFVFFDERRMEFVKIKDPLFTQNLLSLELQDIFGNGQVTNVEGYYDDKYKETNLRFRTKSGKNFIISYNEILQIFNSKMEFDNDLYITFQNKVYAPSQDLSSIGEFNAGSELMLFGEKKLFKVKFITIENPTETKIFKGLAVYIDQQNPILKTIFETSLKHIREILGTHHWYKVREGVHTLPSKNQTDYGDIRGEWCSIELQMESKNNSPIKLFSVINFYRQSYK